MDDRAPTTEIRPLNGPEEAAAVAVLHREALPKGFLSRLGDGALAELYLGIASAPGSVVYVASSEEGKILGFVSGTLDVKSCYASVIRRRGLSLLRQTLPVLTSTTTLQHVAETLFYPFKNVRRQRRDSTREAPRTSAELLSIAVRADTRGQRLGHRLVGELDKFFLDNALSGPYRVVTDAEDPLSNAFYDRSGFRFARLIVHHDHPMNMYLRNPTAASSARGSRACQS